MSFEENVGQIPAGHCVLHRCDVRPCINPDHLFTGTKTDNATDRDAKGRQARGETNGSAIINAETASAIVRDRRAGMTYGQLVKKYSISKSQVARIATGKSWRHINV